MNITKKEVKRIVGAIIAGSAALYGVYKAFETYFYSKYNKEYGDEYENGYDDGNDDGYYEGYDAGYEKGKAEGFDLGKKTGMDEAYLNMQEDSGKEYDFSCCYGGKCKECPKVSDTETAKTEEQPQDPNEKPHERDYARDHAADHVES